MAGPTSTKCQSGAYPNDHKTHTLVPRTHPRIEHTGTLSTCRYSVRGDSGGLYPSILSYLSGLAVQQNPTAGGNGPESEEYCVDSGHSFLNTYHSYQPVQLSFVIYRQGEGMRQLFNLLILSLFNRRLRIQGKGPRKPQLFQECCSVCISDITSFQLSLLSRDERVRSESNAYSSRD